jgi:cell division protein FtsI (penicillin-binding protein 3)
VDEAFKQRRARIGALTLALAGLLVLTGARLTVIVLVDGPRLLSLGRSEHSAEMKLAAVRGPIVDRNGKALALSAETRSIYARPKVLLAATSISDRVRLAAMLGVSLGEVESRLGNGAPFVWLARHLPPPRAGAIEQLGLRGVGVVNEYKRFYPESNLAAAVVGVAGVDGQGLSGVELQYDHLIRGEPARLHFYQDALGHPILDSPVQLRSPRLGSRLELTLDSSIQAQTETFLRQQLVRSGAARGTAVILDPFTGEVLALANVSTGRSGMTDRLHDPAVQDAFEPGSTMKSMLGAIALEDRVADPSRQIYCEKGEWHVAGVLIHDDGRYGWLTLRDIIEVSSNIGAAKLALSLGRRRLYDGISAFGLGRKTGIDLPGEAAGLVSPPSSWREIELANHGFGQGLALTPIQLVTAYAAIANGGLLMRPYVVKAAYDSDGRAVLMHNPQVIRRAISPEVAHTMNEMLRSVVDGREGTAHLARVADFTVAGKTGTAQIIDPATRRYYRDRLVASFVGFLPAEDPRLVVLVVLYDVPGGNFGGLVAAPVFSEIASEALQRMAIAPAYQQLNVANLLPISNPLGSLLWPHNDDSGSELVEPDSRVDYRSALSYRGNSAGADPDQTNLRIPQFRGLSLRSALAIARRHQLALKVTGSGYVVSQGPWSGAATYLNNSSAPEGEHENIQISLADADENPPDPSLVLERMPPRPDSARKPYLAAGSRSGRSKRAETYLIGLRAQASHHRWTASSAEERHVAQ